MKPLEMKSAIYLVVGVVIGIAVYAGYQKIFSPVLNFDSEQVKGTPTSVLPAGDTAAPLENFKLYSNTELGFKLNMPSDATISKYDNNKDIRAVKFQSKKENFTVKIIHDETTLLNKYYYLDGDSSYKATLGGKEAYVFIAPNGYCDGPGCTEPYIAYVTKVNGDFHHLIFEGDITINDIEKAILNSFTFLQAKTSTLTLPVKKMEMSYGVEGCGQTKPVTTQQFAGIPTEFASGVGAFGFPTCGSPFYILGPKGWAGHGNQATDGNLFLSIYPVGSTDPVQYVKLAEYPVCGGCILNAAAPFFPQAKDKAIKEKLYFPSSNDPAPKTIVQLTPNLVAYSSPDSSDGREINGVAYYSSGEVQGQPFFSKMEVKLLPSQHSLATVILNSYIREQELDKE